MSGSLESCSLHYTRAELEAAIGLLLEFFDHQCLSQIIAGYSHGSGDRDVVLRASHLYSLRACLGPELSSHTPRCMVAENPVGPHSLCLRSAAPLLFPGSRRWMERRPATAGNHQPYPGLQR